VLVTHADGKAEAYGAESDRFGSVVKRGLNYAQPSA